MAKQTMDYLRLGIGGIPVYSREETNQASITRTHTHTKSAYMQSKHSCRI